MENNEKDRIDDLANSEETEEVIPSEQIAASDDTTEQKADSSAEPEKEKEEEQTDASSDQGGKENSDPVSDDVLPPSDEEAPKDEAQETAAEAEEKKPKRSTSDIVRTVLICVFIAVFAVSAFMIVLNVVKGQKGKEIYNELNENFFGDSDRTGKMAYLSPAVLDTETPKYGSSRKGSAFGEYSIVETNSPFFVQFKEKLTEYRKINPDIYGWIQVDGTNISYPCVQGKDNTFYLDHTATLENNVNGAIFADFRCDKAILENPNLVFYGHNMILPNQMFADITKFLDESFFNNNRYVTLFTLEGVYRYEIFSVFQTTSTFRYCQIGFMSAESFVKWCNEMNEKSLYSRDTGDFTDDSRVITLSTCTNGNIDDRYALQARLVAIEKAQGVQLVLPDGDEFDKTNPNDDVPLHDLELPLQSMSPEDTAWYPESESVPETYVPALP